MVEEAKAAGVTETKFLDVSHYRKTNIWLIDSKGTITDTRADFKDGKMADHKIPFARVGEEPITDLLTTIKTVKPTALMGLAGQA